MVKNKNNINLSKTLLNLIDNFFIFSKIFLHVKGKIIRKKSSNLINNNKIDTYNIKF